MRCDSFVVVGDLCGKETVMLLIFEVGVGEKGGVEEFGVW